MEKQVYTLNMIDIRAGQNLEIKREEKELFLGPV